MAEAAPARSPSEGLDKTKGPFTATVLMKTPFQITFNSIQIGEEPQVPAPE